MPELFILPKHGNTIGSWLPGLNVVGYCPECAGTEGFEFFVIGLEFVRILYPGPAVHII
jgi:hypothetical protein